MAIFVRHLVPVVAEIDLTTDRVTQVHVDDEAIGEPEAVLVIDQPDLAAADREHAMAVASDQPWPAWELGG